jgi:hypothetical protein
VENGTERSNRSLRIVSAGRAGRLTNSGLAAPMFALIATFDSESNLHFLSANEGVNLS